MHQVAVARSRIPGVFLFWLFPALAFALLVTVRYPVYFHWDDAGYMHWAQTHPNPLDAFRASESTLFSTFRPALLLTWWVLYRAFGLEAFGYQLVVTLLYAVNFLCFGVLLRRLFNVRVAVFALFGYVAVFFHLGYVVFWFSDLSFILEIFWMHFGLFLLVGGFQRPGRVYLWGLPCVALAFLSKEPSVLIVTACLSLYAWAHWKEFPGWARRRAAWLVPSIGAAGALWLAASPGLRARQGISELSSLAGVLSYVHLRWEYYAGQLLAHTGVLLWVAVLFLCGYGLIPRRRRRSLVVVAAVLLVAAVASVALRRHPGPALLVLLAAGITAVGSRRDTAMGVAWAFLPLFGLLGLNCFVRTQLTEASFGFALLMGLAADALLRSVHPDGHSGVARALRSRAIQLGAGAAAIGAVIAVALLFSGLVRGKLLALQVLSDNRLNFRDTTEFLRRCPPVPGTQIAIVSYTDLETSYDRIQNLSDGEKSGMQKTMESHDLPFWWRVLGFGEIRLCRSLAEYQLDPPESCYLWVMNNHERRCVDRLDLEKEELFAAHRHGQGTWLYRVTRGGAEVRISGEPRDFGLRGDRGAPEGPDAPVLP